MSDVKIYIPFANSISDEQINVLADCAVFIEDLHDFGPLPVAAECWNPQAELMELKERIGMVFD